MKTRIDTVLLGKVKAYGPRNEPSAYRKEPVEDTIAINELGLVGNEVADLTVHGGVDKAIMHYAFDHYADWTKEQPQHTEALSAPGAFGENLSSLSMTEDQVCIGDKYRLGSATVEVSQGRQPCWKLGYRFRDINMVREVIKTARSGWYYRVLEEGDVTPGDSIELLERNYPEWTVKRTLTLLLATKFGKRIFGIPLTKKSTRQALHDLSRVQPLSESWRKRTKELIKLTDGK